ncbi:hypothetical protein [Clostridium ihumii]|uniref:hypothetical protein n=1 Tax=Clostridium ihumii TaxID=1470356 RepID=UPI0005534ED9|nr:hypothetical protein [Clostridium ihumii]
MKSIEKSKKFIRNGDKINNEQVKEYKSESLNKIDIETKENDVNIVRSPIINSNFQKDTETEQTIKDNKKEKKQMNIETVNIALSLIFSFSLIVVSIGQYITYNKQANIAANANKLVQYQYRFEFYEKLKDLQKDTSMIKKDPQRGMEEFADLNYKILSLYRESSMLFDQNISKNINDILNEHLIFLNELNNNGMDYDEYKSEIKKLNGDYGDFINSDNFKKYLDINIIE